MLKGLESDDLHIIKECVVAMLDGPFLDEEELSTRIGVERCVLNEILNQLRTYGDDIESITMDMSPVSNCLNEICNGLQIPEAEWQRWFAVSRDEVKRVWNKWTNSV